MENQKLVRALTILLATTYAYQLKIHKYHWNVTGPDFVQYHKFLGKMYEEIHDATDLIAESIRTLNALVPGSFDEFSQYSKIECDNEPNSSFDTMIYNLVDDNKVVIDLIKTTYVEAERFTAYDISDLMTSRLAAHEKNKWMMNSIIGKI
jgi:starvation-inducible DNA-binding protein